MWLYVDLYSRAEADERRRPTPRVGFLRPGAHETQDQRGSQMAVRLDLGNKLLK